MDLNYGPEYEDFKKEVQSFCDLYKDLRFVDSTQSPLASGGKGEHGPELTRSDWQKSVSYTHLTLPTKRIV